MKDRIVVKLMNWPYLFVVPTLHSQFLWFCSLCWYETNRMVMLIPRNQADLKENAAQEL